MVDEVKALNGCTLYYIPRLGMGASFGFSHLPYFKWFFLKDEINGGKQATLMHGEDEFFRWNDEEALCRL